MHAGKAYRPRLTMRANSSLIQRAGIVHLLIATLKSSGQFVETLWPNHASRILKYKIRLNRKNPRRSFIVGSLTSRYGWIISLIWGSIS